MYGVLTLLSFGLFFSKIIIFVYVLFLARARPFSFGAGAWFAIFQFFEVFGDVSRRRRLRSALRSDVQRRQLPGNGRSDRYKTFALELCRHHCTFCI
jgi:hypothetical protein